MKAISIYCDGSVTDNKNPNSDGGFGIIFLSDEYWREKSGYVETPCTNNIAEFLSLYESLIELKTKELHLTIFSDSQLVVNTFHHDPAKRWQRKNERLRKIAEKIDPLLRKFPYTINWVKGHADNRWNNRADELAEIGRVAKITQNKYFKIHSRLIAQPE
jgi:ribonuclease HI